MDKSVKVLDGASLTEIFSAGVGVLEANVEAVNALNVFPVPDGDTGTNMLLTLKAIIDGASDCEDESAGAVAESMAKSALLGARGNSGVILSQFFKGMSVAFNGKKEITSEVFAIAFREGEKASYKAVSKPVEGTILTVIREAANAAEQAVSDSDTPIVDILKATVDASKVAVANTPNQLSVLKDAGVVDAGGEGFYLLLFGALRFLNGEPLTGISTEFKGMSPTGSVAGEFLDETEDDIYGYCTQFLIQGSGLSTEEVREKLTSMAKSAVVIGDETMIKVHVHTLDPGSIVTYAVALGTISQVSMQNMDEQHQEFMKQRREEKTQKAQGIVVVGAGAGIEKLLISLGGDALVRGGQTMNPSAKEILDSVEEVGADAVIVLPNNPNVIPVSNQTSSLTSRTVKVVPTKTIPEGIAALLAFDPELDIDSNVEAMNVAIESVISGSVCEAVRDSSIDGFNVKKGQILGLLDDKIVSVRPDHTAALRELVAKAKPESGSVVTLYWGEGKTEDNGNNDAEILLEDFPEIEVEVVYGGQQYYSYIVSIE